MKAIARDVRDKAYVAWLGHTKAKALGWSKQELVDRANAMAVDDYKLVDILALTPRRGFMGLKQSRRPPH
ncbi:helicase [Aureococcus anophagefferens]|nr:helicase [Aureococcus anophagefferens]